MKTNYNTPKLFFFIFLILLITSAQFGFCQNDFLLELNLDHTEPPPKNVAEKYSFEVNSVTSSLIISVTSSLEQGSCKVKLVNPQENIVQDFSWQKKLTLNSPVVINQVTGVYILEVTSENLIGTTTINIKKTEGETQIAIFNILGGCLMIIIGVAFVTIWKSKTSVAMKWFWAGAGIWFIGVLLKFAFAIPFNAPILQTLEEGTPKWVYLTIGSIYVGLLTGIFEIGITLLIAKYWRGMTKNSSRAIAVGIGAGAIEAILLGIPVTIAAAMGYATTGFWLAIVGPVERLLTVFLHMASRALTLLTIATGKMNYFWAGFLLLTTVDSIAGWVHLSEYMKTYSVWWIELAILPFTVLSIIILRWCIQKWPSES